MEINYDLIHSNRKTIGITVERDKNIVIRAPKEASQEEIDDFIKRKKYWIYTKLKHPQKYKKNTKKEFVSGASILYLGKHYKLDIVKEDLEGIKFLNKFMISKNNQENARDLFKQWYISKAKEKIIPKVQEFAEKLGVNCNSINIKEFTYRWGSCTPNNNINFNWRLIKAPTSVIDYVVVHELAHLLEPNHSNKFWSIVKTQIPKYKDAKEWLKTNGQLLESDFN